MNKYNESFFEEHKKRDTENEGLKSAPKNYRPHLYYGND